MVRIYVSIYTAARFVCNLLSFQALQCLDVFYLEFWWGEILLNNLMLYTVL